MIIKADSLPVSSEAARHLGSESRGGRAPATMVDPDEELFGRGSNSTTLDGSKVINNRFPSVLHCALVTQFYFPVSKSCQ